MNKQELASKIWALANELRGKVSAATYKDYMLGFLFYKYLSDREENYLKTKLFFSDDDLVEATESDEKLKENCMNNLGYFISYDNLFSTWVKIKDDFSIENVTVALSAFERHISQAYDKVFNNIFTTLSTRLTELGTTDLDRTKNSKDIIKLVKTVPTDNREDYDVLGFIYEYLLKNFAANAGKAGEFYTPHEASVIMSEIIAYSLKGRDEIKIYDPTSGSGSLLITIGQAVSKYLGDKNKVHYYAQELIPETYNLTRMNLVMRGVLPSNITARQGDTLDKDWPYFDDKEPEQTYDYLRVDACCSNPPYSYPWTPRNDPRFDNYGLAPKSKADYAFLLHNLYHLNNDGIMTIVLPHGVLFRGGEEEIIRTNLIKRHNIETIIGLPSNLFYGTGIATIIMVLRKNRLADDVLFVDASKGFAKEGNKNKLRQRDIRKIIDTVIARKDVEYYSRLVSYKEIESNDFNLNIPRYVDSNVPEASYDLYATMFGGIPNEEIDGFEFEKVWVNFPTLKSDLFDKENACYSNLKAEDTIKIIESNHQVKSFVQSHKDSFSYLSEFLEDELLNKIDTMHIDSEECKIASSIKDHLRDNGLIDYYDCYEVLDDAWQYIASDLEIIKEQGFDAGRCIDEVKVLKKDSKTKKLEEKVAGYDGRLIPFSLIQKLYFPEKSDEVSDLENQLSSFNSMKDDLLDSIDPNDKGELTKDDGSGDIVSKKLNSKISEIKKKIKMGAEFEDDSYENILIKVNDANENIKKLKEKLKKASSELSSSVENKIKCLTDDEIRCLLKTKWIKPICDGIEELSSKLIRNLEKNIKSLHKKYELTYIDLNDQIVKTENDLSLLLEELDANEYDEKALLELKKMLGGE